MPSLTVEPYDFLLSSPLRTARGLHRRRRGFVLTLRCGRHRGLGETAPLAGWTESYSRAARKLTRLTGSYRSWRELRGAMDRLDGYPATRHGLHMAITDWKARYNNRRFVSELGTRRRPSRVSAAAVVGRGTAGETSTRIRQRREEGYRTVKLKVGGRPLEEERSVLRSVVQNLPSDLDPLRLDANGSWTLREAAQILRDLEDEPVSYLEQPLPAGCFSMTELLPGTIRLAWDEELTGLRFPGELRDLPVDVLIVKPMVLGGLDRALNLIDLAGDLGMKTVLSTSLESTVGRWGLVHLAAARRLPAAGLGLSVGPESDLIWPEVEAEGTVPLPEGPGLGVSVP